jgi:asparagine synthetase B (glutamine-hydrolysing)
MATLGMGAMDRTLFHGVSPIPPAHYLIAQAGGVTIRQYWDFDYPREEDLPAGRRDEEYAEEFRAAAAGCRANSHAPTFPWAAT